MRRATPYIALLGFIVAGAVLLASTPAQAQQAGFTIIVVKATNDGDSMDQALQPYAHLLKGKGYTSFTKLRSAVLTLDQGKSGSVSIAGDLKAELTYTSEINGRVAFKCRILKGDALQAAVGYSVPRGGKTVVVVSGQTGYMLIIEVR
jgi:hypothetical protein